MKRFIVTYTGQTIDPLDPDPLKICVTDIAHALSNICRWTGHVKQFYSVAQHSVLVSRLCDPRDALWGLLHDASEAYLSDIARSVKPWLPGYKDFEKRLMDDICLVYNLQPDMPKSVHDADEIMLRREWLDLMEKPPEAEFEGYKIEDLDLMCPGPLVPCGPQEAKRLFLLRFNQLTTHRV